MTTPVADPSSDTPKSSNSLVKVLAPVVGIVLLVVGAMFAVRFVATGGATLGSTSNSQGSHAQAADLRVGSVLPDFTLQPFGPGSKDVRASQLPSKVTLINFWATWCDACVLEMPSIVKLRENYKSQGFNVVAISVDQNPDEVLPSALKKLGIDFGVYSDSEAKLADLFQIESIPLTVVIDSNRKILMIEARERDWNAPEIRASIEKWLSG